jgi:hypothetical protein
MKNRKLLLLSLTVMSLILACLGGRALIQHIFASPLRKGLPTTATQIREWRWSEGGLTGQDYVYLLRAKITQQEFLDYVDKFDMTPHTPERGYSRGFVLDWHPHTQHSDEALEWWTPSPNFDNTYAHDGGSWWRYAKWENGYIYLVSCSI